MEEKYGRKIYGGIAIGRIRFHERTDPQVVRTEVGDAGAEIVRYESAQAQAVQQLDALYRTALAKVGEDNAEIFHAQAMMLEDGDFYDSVCDIIRTQGVNAEFAVSTTGDRFAKMFSDMEEEYFRARSADVLDITKRVVTILCGGGDDGYVGDEPVILVAEDLAPSETVQMDRSRLLAFVTRSGSANSHTAILARTMGIPALTGVEIDRSWDGRRGIVDGDEGRLIVDPEPAVLERYLRKKEADDGQKRMLESLKGQENVTRSGQKIDLFANIGSPDDLADALGNDAGGIGLFRSEFLYLESDHYPTEEEQFEAYRKVVETMDGRKVVIRTLDIGADKRIDYFDLDREENPALGYRAIRICLTRPEIFRTQLRALFRASAYGNLAIMYPMIISRDEVRAIRALSREIREDLISEGVQIGEVEEGIMVETPAAAVMSDELAEEVDFFSIGTNDLTQYTLAIDRQNAKLDPFYDPHHPAVLRMIRTVADNAHRAGIWVGICGELGADTELTGAFLEMGIDELSVAPGRILPVRRAIREAP